MEKLNLFFLFYLVLYFFLYLAFRASQECDDYGQNIWRKEIDEKHFFIYILTLNFG